MSGGGGEPVAGGDPQAPRQTQCGAGQSGGKALFPLNFVVTVASSKK
jgi:hypothetical protein